MSITMRRSKIGAITAALVVSAGLVTANFAFASHPEVSLSGSNFEIDTDANLKRDDASPSIDWASVTEVRRSEQFTGSQDDSFGNGTKENTAVPSIVDGGIPPNKSDLKHFGVYQEGAGGSGFLNLYWSRVQDPSGTTNMDFEFNQRQCTPGQTPVDPDCSANGITPLREAEDLLITYDLSNGGVNPGLSLREWNGSSWVFVSDLTESDKATGSINNGTAIPAGEADGLGAHSLRTFGEAQIDLAAVFGTDCQSFGSAYLKSRSSDSFTAAVKDFVRPAAVNISNCGSVRINKTGNNLNGGPLADAEFTLYNNVAPLAGPRGAGDTATTMTCTTNAQGSCTISDVPFGEYWLVETDPPPNYDAVADQAVSIQNTTQVVFNLEDVRQTVSTSIATQQRWLPNHRATITASPGQGDLAGTVTFYLYEAVDCTGTPLTSFTKQIPADAEAGGTVLSRTVLTGNTSFYTADKNIAWKVEFDSTNPGQLDSQSLCDRSSVDIISNTP